jgi:hypothetical protein
MQRGNAGGWRRPFSRRDVIATPLTIAKQKHGQIEEQLTAFLASAPQLARELARWQAEDAKT